MGLLQQPVQAKLSKLIGAEVRFEHLSVSLLGGSIEARGVTIAGDNPAEPVLTIRRVRAEISIPRALKKEIVVKSLTIEAPVLSVVRRADGGTNLPKPIKPPDDEPETPPAPRAKAEAADDGAGGAWRLEAQRVLLVDGSVRYHADPPPGGETLDLSADGILGELKSAGGGFDFTCIVESLGRRGARAAELGQAKCAGRADGVEDLSQILKAKVTATLDAGELLHAEINVPSLKPLEASVKAHAHAEVEKLLPFLPAMLASKLPAEPKGGNVQLTLAASCAGAELTVSEFVIRATGVRVKT
jgi:hypothetical protein